MSQNSGMMLTLTTARHTAKRSKVMIPDYILFDGGGPYDCLPWHPYSKVVCRWYSTLHCLPFISWKWYHGWENYGLTHRQEGKKLKIYRDDKTQSDYQIGCHRSWFIIINDPAWKQDISGSKDIDRRLIEWIWVHDYRALNAPYICTPIKAFAVVPKLKIILKGVKCLGWCVLMVAIMTGAMLR